MEGSWGVHEPPSTRLPGAGFEALQLTVPATKERPAALVLDSAFLVSDDNSEGGEDGVAARADEDLASEDEDCSHKADGANGVGVGKTEKCSGPLGREARAGGWARGNEPGGKCHAAVAKQGAGGDHEEIHGEQGGLHRPLDRRAEQTGMVGNKGVGGGGKGAMDEEYGEVDKKPGTGMYELEGVCKFEGGISAGELVTDDEDREGEQGEEDASDHHSGKSTGLVEESLSAEDHVLLGRKKGSGGTRGIDRDKATTMVSSAAGYEGGDDDMTFPDLDDIEAHAESLGMDPENDRHLLWIAEQSLMAPLPDGWREEVDESGRVYFWDCENQEAHSSHPFDEEYRYIYTKLKGRLERNPVSREEVLEMAAYLSIDPDEEPHLLWIARHAVLAPLPDGWEEVEDDKGVFFYDRSTHTAQEEHPLDEVFLLAVVAEREKAKGRGKNLAGLGSSLDEVKDASWMTLVEEETGEQYEYNWATRTRARCRPGYNKWEYASEEQHGGAGSEDAREPDEYSFDDGMDYGSGGYEDDNDVDERGEEVADDLDGVDVTNVILEDSPSRRKQLSRLTRRPAAKASSEEHATKGSVTQTSDRQSFAEQQDSDGFLSSTWRVLQSAVLKMVGGR